MPSSNDHTVPGFAPRCASDSAGPISLDEILGLEKLDDLLFRSQSHSGTGPRLFGGQVAGQAVMAAGHTSPKDRTIHSAHTHFLLPGDASTPVLYHVDPVRDGGSFTTRRVEAVQHGKVIFHLTASFQKPELGISHQVPVLDAPGPDEIPPPEEQFRDDPEGLAWIRLLMSRNPVEFRFPDIPGRISVLRGQASPPRQSAWIRSTASLPDDDLHHAGALMYISDLLLLSTALGPHGLTIQDPNLQFATIDHTVWFHSPCRADEWFLHDQESFWADSGRAVCRGSFFDQSGKLVATAIQEGLLRLRPAKR